MQSTLSSTYNAPSCFTLQRKAILLALSKASSQPNISFKADASGAA